MFWIVQARPVCSCWNRGDTTGNFWKVWHEKDTSVPWQITNLILETSWWYPCKWGKAIQNSLLYQSPYYYSILLFHRDPCITFCGELKEIRMIPSLRSLKNDGRSTLYLFRKMTWNLEGREMQSYLRANRNILWCEQIEGQPWGVVPGDLLETSSQRGCERWEARGLTGRTVPYILGQASSLTPCKTCYAQSDSIDEKKCSDVTQGQFWWRHVYEHHCFLVMG